TAQSGTVAAALVEGEAGIGNSRLLAETARLAAGKGFDVRTAKVDELERERPFGGIADALGLRPDAEDPEAAAIGAGLLGEGQPGLAAAARPPELTFRLVEAIVGLVRRLARSRPVLVAVDDLQ